MENKIFAALIAKSLQLTEQAVANTLALIDEGCTIPFISRYRKERTGGLNEVQIAAICDQYERLQETAKRKETVLKTITEQEKLTPELKKRIDAWRTSTCPSNRNVALVRRWLANRDWSRWLRRC